MQASIDYVRYLEDCVSTLKSQRDAQPSATTPTEFVLPPPVARRAYDHDGQQYLDEDEAEAGDMDVDMTGSEAASPSFTPTTSRSQQPSVSPSPALLAEDARRRHDSYSSASTDHRHYSYSTSSTTSPAFGPQSYSFARGPVSASNSTLTSPALMPQRDLDQEATAALLMLNTDRRGTNGSSAGRGMSVRDLLST